MSTAGQADSMRQTDITQIAHLHQTLSESNVSEIQPQQQRPEVPLGALLGGAAAAVGASANFYECYGHSKLQPSNSDEINKV